MTAAERARVLELRATYGYTSAREDAIAAWAEARGRAAMVRAIDRRVRVAADAGAVNLASTLAHVLAEALAEVEA